MVSRHQGGQQHKDNCQQHLPSGNLDSTPGILGESKTFGGKWQHKGLERQPRQPGNLRQNRNVFAQQKVGLELQNLSSAPGILGESKTFGEKWQHKGLER